MAISTQSPRTLYWYGLQTPPGTFIVMATEQGVCWLGTPGSTIEHGVNWARRYFPIEQVVEGTEIEPMRLAVMELQRYLAGEKVSFTCPLELYGTPFQLLVWQALRDIPYGETRSYIDIARAIGRPTACRAVGAANGANPIAVIVPCHRVIGSNRSLTGYGGGLPTKDWLLTLEGVNSYRKIQTLALPI